MKSLLTLVSVFMILARAVYSDDGCKLITAEDFAAVFSKSDMEIAISQIIPRYLSDSGSVDWATLAICFEELGDRYIVEHYPSGGFFGGDIYRFTVDRSNSLTSLTSAPGASNDVFTAIINITASGQVSIIRRGGELNWLKLE